jgi:PleD family two-component response regulator
VTSGCDWSSDVCSSDLLGDQEPALEAVKRADAAMYMAKRAGKNRVVAA